jgi:peptidoglycan/LPS O-acetylase OafA/YrhL
MAPRNGSLDALRGLAVIMVVVCHYFLGIERQSAFSLAMGHGVDLFFVLSGFLISGLFFAEIKRTGHIDSKRFWIRRGFKIYPPFYVFLTLTCIFIFRGIPRPQIYAELFFVQDYFSPLWVHTWSLAVEEQFYFTLPLFLIVLLRGKVLRIIPVTSLVLSCLCFYLRFRAFQSSGVWDNFAYPAHLRMDALLAGVVLGYYAYFDQSSFRETRKAFVLVLGVTITIFALAMPPFFQLTFCYIGFAFVVAWSVQHPVSKWLYWLSYIGLYSYSIYLWHVALMVFLPRFPANWMRFPVYVLSSVLLGIGMAKAVEVPSLRIRDRLFPSLSNRSASGTVASQLRGSPRPMPPSEPSAL